MPLLHASVGPERLDPDALRALVDSPEAGAVTCFLGQIRNHDPEASGEVTGIDYSAHPDAPALIGPIVERVLADLDPDAHARVAAAHRIGPLAVGEHALVVCVATPHRELGFAVCAEVVEAIKRDLPIWKRQEETSGRTAWSNLGLEAE